MEGLLFPLPTVRVVMCHNEISFWDCTVHFYTSILWFNYISGPLPSQLHSWECDWWSMHSICDQSVTIWIIPSMCTYLFRLQWSLGNSRHGCIVGDPNNASTPHPKQCCGLFLKKSLSLMFYISFVLSHVPAPMDEDACLSDSDNDISAVSFHALGVPSVCSFAGHHH